MKNLLILFLTIFSSIATSFTSNTQAQMPQVGKTYYIQSIVSSSRYLSTKDGATSTRTRVVIDQKTSRNEKAMQWTMVNAGGGYYKFIQKSSGKTLDVSGKRTTPKTPLWIWPKANPGEAQRFRLKDGGKGYFYLIPKINDNMRVDIEGSRSTAGTGVWTLSRNGSKTQKWKFIEVSSTTNNGSSGNYVRIPKSKITGFANLIMKGMRLRLNNFGTRYRDRNDDVYWNKNNDSYIKLGGRTNKFNIEQYTRGVRDKMYYVNDVNLRRATTSFEGNRFVLTLTFEEDGTELKGMCSNCAGFREDNGAPDFQIDDHTWKVYLKLIPYNNSIAFEVESIKFLGDIDGQGFGELFDGIVQRKLIPIMKKEIKKTLLSQRSYIASEIKKGVESAGYRIDRVSSVYADGNNVTILTR